MGDQTHRIERQILEIVVADPESAKQLQATLSRLQRQKIERIIERVCDRIAGPETLLRIDRLSIDLGEINSDHFETELTQALHRQLGSCLEAADKGAPRLRRISDEQVARQEIEFFARTGALPWNSQRGDAKLLQQRVHLLQSDPKHSLAALLRNLDEQPRALERLASHFDDNTLGALVDALLSPSRLRSIASAGDAVRAQHEFKELLRGADGLSAESSRRRHTHAWFGLLRAAARHRPGSCLVTQRLYDTALDALSQSTGKPLQGARRRLHGLASGSATEILHSPTDHKAASEAANPSPSEESSRQKSSPTKSLSEEPSRKKSPSEESSRKQSSRKQSSRKKSPNEESTHKKRSRKKSSHKTSPSKDSSSEESPRQESLHERPPSEKPPREGSPHRLQSPPPPNPETRKTSAPTSEQLVSEPRQKLSTETDPRPSDHQPSDPQLADLITTWAEIASTLSKAVGSEKSAHTGPPNARALASLKELIEVLVALGEALQGTSEPSIATLLLAQYRRTPLPREGIDFSLMAVANAGRRIRKDSAAALSRDLGELRKHIDSQAPTGNTSPRAPEVKATTTAPPKPVRRTPRRAQDIDQLHIDDAGLVILWPFLRPLFTHLGLLEGLRFRDPSAQLRAAALLRHVAGGEFEIAEFQLPLAKILCGLEPDALFDLDTPLQDEESSECTRMLEAVILRAPVLKKMSVAGLRGTFLLRPGILRVRDDSWLLRVEERAFDLVLQRFPWTFEWIKLPWMQTPLQVEWCT